MCSLNIYFLTCISPHVSTSRNTDAIEMQTLADVLYRMYWSCKAVKQCFYFIFLSTFYSSVDILLFKCELRIFLSFQNYRS